MLPTTDIVLSLKMLLHLIFNRYLNSSSYCITVVSEVSLDLQFLSSFSYIYPHENLTDQMLLISEQGCSDYIVLMKEPENFMKAFENVNHLGNTRRSDKKVIFLPFLESDFKSSQSLLKVLTMKETSDVANVLLVLPSVEQVPGCDIFDLVTHKFVGADNQIRKPMVLDQWNSCTNKTQNGVNLFPHKITNMYGKVLKIACFTYKPYILLDLDPNMVPNGRDGIEIRVVEEFCRWINCTIELVRVEENLWGELYDNLTGTGILGSVIEGHADLGITALYSWYDVYKVLDFTAPWIKTSITCVAPAAKLLVSWELPLLPFSWLMWTVLLVTFIYASFALALAQRSFDKAFFSTFGMMVTQSQNDAGSRWRIRSITGWLLITGLIIDNAYGGGLASAFTVPKYEKPIDTIQDIVDRRIEWGANSNAWLYSLNPSTETLIKQLISQFRVYPNEILSKKSKEMAYSIEKLPAGYFAIGEYITADSMMDLQLMAENFYYEQCVGMLRKSSAYTDKISQLVGWLHESGLILAWETQIALYRLNYQVQLEVKLSRSRRDVERIEPLSLRHVVGIFIVYTIGLALSAFVFVMEIINKKLQSDLKSTKSY